VPDGVAYSAQTRHTTPARYGNTWLGPAGCNATERPSAVIGKFSSTTGWCTILRSIIFQRSLGVFDAVRLQQPLPNLFKVWRFRLAGGEG
jgi:hypothetical protein